MKNKVFTSRFISGVGILIAIEIILYVLGAISPSLLGGTNLNLALIPVAIGAIFYGPVCGIILGLINGVATLLTPGVQAYYMNTDLFGEWCIFGTILVCLSKVTVAGLVSGYIYKILKGKREILAIILASLVVPFINTGIFVGLALVFFSYKLLDILVAIFSLNFLIELLTTAVLTPAIIRITKFKNFKGNYINNNEGVSNEKE